MKSSINTINKNFTVAGGCFWGVQAYFAKVKGVSSTLTGYTGGTKEFPSYKEVCAGTTGHTEAVMIEYNPNVTNIVILMRHYLSIVDPTTLNYQKNDFGTQYRSAIYYNDEDECEILKEIFIITQKKYTDDIVTELLPLQKFWTAEEYHQHYLEYNPRGYCHIPKFKYKFIEDIDNAFRKFYEFDDGEDNDDIELSNEK